MNRPFFAISFQFLASHSLITPSQIRHFHQICHFCRNRQRSTCLVGHLIWILANLKWIVAKFAIFTKFVIFLKIGNCQHATFSTFWIFGQTLDESLVHVIFAKIYPYHLNLPFSCNGYLYKMPPFVSFEFCQIFDVFFPKFIDLKKLHFRKNPQLRTSFFCHLVLIFAKPLINWCQIRHFHLSCYSCKNC